jgi:hypothetical protein
LLRSVRSGTRKALKRPRTPKKFIEQQNSGD